MPRRQAPVTEHRVRRLTQGLDELSRVCGRWDLGMLGEGCDLLTSMRQETRAGAGRAAGSWTGKAVHHLEKFPSKSRRWIGRSFRQRPCAGPPRQSQRSSSRMKRDCGQPSKKHVLGAARAPIPSAPNSRARRRIGRKCRPFGQRYPHPTLRRPAQDIRRSKLFPRLGGDELRGLRGWTPPRSSHRR